MAIKLTDEHTAGNSTSVQLSNIEPANAHPTEILVRILVRESKFKLKP